MAEKFIEKAIKRPGAFKAKAKRRGKTTRQFVRTVLSNPDRFDTRTVRQANLAKTLLRLGRR